jgi:hypothetical protein
VAHGGFVHSSLRGVCVSHCLPPEWSDPGLFCELLRCLLACLMINVMLVLNPGVNGGL